MHILRLIRRTNNYYAQKPCPFVLAQTVQDFQTPHPGQRQIQQDQARLNPNVPPSVIAPSEQVVQRFSPVADRNRIGSYICVAYGAMDQRPVVGVAFRHQYDFVQVAFPV
jgi:hypothetical protein